MPDHSPPAIELRDVRKRFVIRHEAARTFQGMALAMLGRRPMENEEFWALDGVNLTVAPGETLGIIGPNGSGKSTILKLLAGTIQATEGQVTARGRVFGLLELGAGMHPDLTGRENVFLNGSFLGLDRRSIQAMYDDIVAFAELEQFIDTPVKHYSSGMFMRLGFAIAVHVDPEILLIDEVLAVGDASFAAKCYAALARVKRRGRTMVLVSHDPIQVRRFCDRVVWLDRGKVRLAGDPRKVIQDYVQHMQGGLTPGDVATAQRAVRGPTDLRIRAAVLRESADGPEQYSVLPGDTVTVAAELEARSHLTDVIVGCALHRSDGLLVAESTTEATIGPLEVAPGRTVVTCRLGPLPLGVGTYNVSLRAWPEQKRHQPYHCWDNALTLFVGKLTAFQRGAVVLPAQWRAGLSRDHPPLERSDAPVAQPDMISEPPRQIWRNPPAELRLGEGDDDWLGEGWHPPEEWPPRLRWTTDRAVAYVTQSVGQGAVRLSVCRPFHDIDGASAQVRLNGRHVATFTVRQMDFEDVIVPLDPVTEPTTLQLEITVDAPFVPAAAGIDDDTRVLGLAVRSISVE